MKKNARIPETTENNIPATNPAGTKPLKMVRMPAFPPPINSHFSAPPPQVLLVPTGQGLELLPIESIKRLSAERVYTRFHLDNGACLLVSHNIGEYERLLTTGHHECFYRLHESHIVNLRFMRRFLFEDGGVLQMDDGSRIPVAKRRKKAFLDWLKKVCSPE